MFQRCQGDLHVRRRRRHDAHQVYIVAGDQLMPVIGHVANLEFIGHALGVITVSAGDRYDASANAIFESRYLRGAGKTGTHNANANDFVSCQAVTPNR